MALIYDLDFTGAIGTAINNGGGDYVPDAGAQWVGLTAGGGFVPALDGAGNVYVPAGEGQRMAVSPAAMPTNATILVTGVNNRETGATSLLLRWPFTNSVGDLFSGGYRISRLAFADGIEIRKDESTTLAASSTYTGIYDQFSIAGPGDDLHVTIEDNGSSQPMISVWINGNLGTADLTYTDTTSPYTTGRVGLAVQGNSFNNSRIGRIRVYDTVFAPSAPVIPKNDNQDPRRILRRGPTRSSRLL